MQRCSKTLKMKRVVPSVHRTQPYCRHQYQHQPWSFSTIVPHSFRTSHREKSGTWMTKALFSTLLELLLMMVLEMRLRNREQSRLCRVA